MNISTKTNIVYSLVVFIMFNMIVYPQSKGVQTGTEGSMTAKVGFVGAQFLKIDVGARGFSMGSAIDPIVEGALAVFWNPAGLAKGSKSGLFTSKTKWLAGVNHMAAAFSMKAPGGIPGNIALSYVGLSSDKMAVTSVSDQDGSISGETFSVTNSALGLGYAINLTDKFSFGMHAKMVLEDYTNGLSGVDDTFGASKTWAVDVGTLYLSGYKTLRIGMSIRNFGPEVRLGGTYVDFNEGDTLKTEDEILQYNDFKPHGLPLTFRFGIAADLIQNENMKVTFSVVGEHPPDNHERLNLGIEAHIIKFLALRGGYVFNHDTRGGSVGFGLNSFPIAGVGRIDADFAITEFALFDPVWMASFGLTF